MRPHQTANRRELQAGRLASVAQVLSGAALVPDESKGGSTQTDNTKRTITAVVVASLIGVAGLTTAGIGLMWVAGTLGVSTAAASQIVSAIEAGGWALAVVMAVFGAGVIGAIVATVRGMLGRMAKSVVVA